MSTAVMMKRIAEVSPRLKARIAGVFYLVTFLTGRSRPLRWWQSRYGSRPHRWRELCRCDAALLLYF